MVQAAFYTLRGMCVGGPTEWRVYGVCYVWAMSATISYAKASECCGSLFDLRFYVTPSNVCEQSIVITRSDDGCMLSDALNCGSGDEISAKYKMGGAHGRVLMASIVLLFVPLRYYFLMHCDGG
jgi:hypothetical protein